MKIDEKILQEELTTLKSDFDKTKKQIELWSFNESVGNTSVCSYSHVNNIKLEK